MQREATITVGDIVLVRLDLAVERPMIVTRIGLETIYPRLHDVGQTELRASGVVFCEPEDHNTPAVRGLTAVQGDPARFTGRPERYNPVIYAESLAGGPGLGQWRAK